MRANYHTHCSFCHGAGDPEDYVQASIDLNLEALGFSCHAPLPFPNSFTMEVDKLHEYVTTIQRLKTKYAEDIQIFIGLEVDFIPGLGSYQSAFSELGLDYTIGSVHFVDHDELGHPWGIDADPDIFVKGIATVYQGNGRSAVERYYALVRQMIEETSHDMVGHLDVIKKNNIKQTCFSETEPWYDDAVNETLALIAKKSRIVEVSTAGIRKGVGLYPSSHILRRCKELNIRLTLSSDAHHPSELVAHYTEVEALLWSLGYREIYQLTSKGWRSRPLSSLQEN